MYDLQWYINNFSRGFFKRNFQKQKKILIWNSWIKLTLLVKKTMDFTISLTALIGLSPLLGLVAILVKIQDRGPVLYESERVGLYGKPFKIMKFRTMKVDSENQKSKLMKKNLHKDNVTFKIKQDPRVTPIGKWLRKLSIDELPQLWNVLKGDMSLVGPRPPLPQEVAKYTLNARRRLDVKPGITCIWQVSGRSDIPFDQQVELDKQYISSESVLLDIKLLLKTIPAVLSGRGAY